MIHPMFQSIVGCIPFNRSHVPWLVNPNPFFPSEKTDRGKSSLNEVKSSIFSWVKLVFHRETHGSTPPSFGTQKRRRNAWVYHQRTSPSRPIHVGDVGDAGAHVGDANFGEDVGYFKIFLCFSVFIGRFFQILKSNSIFSTEHLGV